MERRKRRINFSKLMCLTPIFVSVAIWLFMTQYAFQKYGMVGGFTVHFAGMSTIMINAIISVFVFL